MLTTMIIVVSWVLSQQKTLFSFSLLVSLLAFIPTMLGNAWATWISIWGFVVCVVLGCFQVIGTQHRQEHE
ncbi:hypothetical protein D3C78_19470 [compost metagenome]